MLKEIKCNIFREKTIYFHKGLNVVLGDNEATNSIGKSTLLMIVDFIFGGNTYCKHNLDVMKELGDHEFMFCFLFENKKFKFMRSTNKPDTIYKCDDLYRIVDSMKLKQYTLFLKEKYKINCMDVSFRTVVSLYSRIWGKKNYDVKRPLHSFSSDKNEDTIINLIKLFNTYDAIKSLSVKINKEKNAKTILNNASKHEYLPKITKRKYNSNLKRIEQLQLEIEEIKKRLSKYVLNTTELTNKEILELKSEKDKMLNIKNQYDYKLKRINVNLSKNSHVKSKQLEKLVDFFPNVNIKKIEEIEEFHSGITKIVKIKLKESQKNILNSIDKINNEISIIDNKINKVLKNVENPDFIVEKVSDLTVELNRLINENSVFEKKESLTSSIKTTQDKLKESKELILSSLEKNINFTMAEINQIVHGKNRKAPYLSLGEKNYDFRLNDDTGTGKAYTNLLIFDLTILKLTDLPIIIHDSLLFKNIENTAVNNLFEVYATYDNQIFISIDEINKYSSLSSKIIKNNTVIELGDNQLLFTKDWRK